MTRKLYYLLPLLLIVVIAAGCAKSTDDTNTTTVILPVGNFSGQFTRIHLNSATKKLDTIHANLTIAMAAATGYAVSGDTTYHAASYGGYVVDGVNIAFADQTLLQKGASTITPTKTHLNGTYSYTYNAPNLQIYFSSDTVIYSYVLVAK